MIQRLPPNTSPPGVAFEWEKWAFECGLREREVTVKEQEQKTKEDDLALKKAEHASSHWKSPLVVAILAAAVAGGGNAIVAYLNGNGQVALETQKSEQARILEMIKTGSPDKAAENLKFLLEAGLIRDPKLRTDLATYLRTRVPGTGPALPTAFSPRDLPDLVSKFEGTVLQPYKPAIGAQTIGSGHVLTPEEVKSGKIMIDGVAVNFTDGITKEQAARLLEIDLAPIRAAIAKLVHVKLTKNQEDALVSFAFNVGVARLARSELLKKVNDGKYDEVPAELMKHAKIGDVVSPSMVKRRESEAALWSKK